MGIDLASQPEKTAVCLLGWGHGSPELLTLRRGKSSDGTEFHDKWLANTARGNLGDYPGPITKVGIDAPFGWPDEFVDAISEYRESDTWPSEIDHSRAQFRLRETDRIVHALTGKEPLSVSSEWIAMCAMRCATLLSYIGLRLGPASVARAGSGLCCEVYPDPALRLWAAGTDADIGHRASYKGAADPQIRLDFLTALLELLPVTDPRDELAAVAREDDYLDALISALVARAVELGQTHEPLPGEQARRAASEGWIHIPNGPLEALNKQS
jgi:hypothetical protein